MGNHFVARVKHSYYPLIKTKQLVSAIPNETTHNLLEILNGLIEQPPLEINIPALHSRRVKVGLQLQHPTQVRLRLLELSHSQEDGAAPVKGHVVVGVGVNRLMEVRQRVCQLSACQ